MFCHRKIIVLWSGINHECLAAGKILMIPFPVCLRQNGDKRTIKAVCTNCTRVVSTNINKHHTNKITLYKAVLKYVVLPLANFLFPFPVAIAPPAKFVRKNETKCFATNVLPPGSCSYRNKCFPAYFPKMVMFCHRKIIK